MRKGWFSAGLLFAAIFVLTTTAWCRNDTIKIGINAPLTGDIPKVGEGTKFAAQMWLEDLNAKGGLDVGGKQYPVELVIEDNERQGRIGGQSQHQDDYRG